MLWECMDRNDGPGRQWADRKWEELEENIEVDAVRLGL